MDHLKPAGKFLATANQRPRKWFRTYWIRNTEDGTATLIQRRHFWCSTEGKVETFTNEDALPITREFSPNLGRIVECINGEPVKTVSAWEVEKLGLAQ